MDPWNNSSHVVHAKNKEGTHARTHMIAYAQSVPLDRLRKELPCRPCSSRCLQLCLSPLQQVRQASTSREFLGYLFRFSLAPGLRRLIVPVSSVCLSACLSGRLLVCQPVFPSVCTSLLTEASVLFNRLRVISLSSLCHQHNPISVAFLIPSLPCPSPHFPSSSIQP